VDLIEIYQCFCDLTRLRILHLLGHGPLCVCHFQTLLGESQVKISKHLSYLRARKLVEVQRHQNWMIYRLPEDPPAELELNLKCLQDCVRPEPIFKRDAHALKAMGAELEWIDGALSCCGSSQGEAESGAPKKKSR